MRRRAGQLIPLVMLLAGCHAVKEAPPRVKLVEVPVRQYVNVPPALLARCEWPKDWPKRRVLESNAIRGKCLEQYEAHIDEIGKLGGGKP